MEVLSCKVYRLCKCLELAAVAAVEVLVHSSVAVVAGDAEALVCDYEVAAEAAEAVAGH